MRFSHPETSVFVLAVVHQEFVGPKADKLLAVPEPQMGAGFALIVLFFLQNSTMLRFGHNYQVLCCPGGVGTIGWGADDRLTAKRRSADKVLTSSVAGCDDFRRRNYAAWDIGKRRSRSTDRQVGRGYPGDDGAG